MRLLDQALKKRFFEIGSQEGKSDPLVVAVYFNYLEASIWYATEYFPDRHMFYGYVSLYGDHYDEWGYFTLADLLNVEAERVMFFEPTPVSEIIPGLPGFIGFGE